METNKAYQVGHICRIEIGMIPPFTDNNEFIADPNINVFIGANSTGKTTILRLIKSKGPGSRERGTRPRFAYMTNGEGRIGHVYVKSENGEALAQTIDSAPVIWIPSSRVPLVPAVYASASYGQYSEDFKGLDDASDHPSVLFASDVSQVISYHFRNIRDEESIVRVFDVVSRALECVKEIYPEMLNGESPDSYIDVGYVTHPGTDSDIRIPVVRYLMGLGISNSDNPITNVSELSSGIQLSYVWIIYMALRMAYFYQWGPSWHEKPGILCVDEIDNHLHPAWQRKILRALSRHFPNVQIFATTHSPFIVGGLRSGQVHILTRDEHKIIRAETKSNDMIAYTADEILSEIMGMDHPTDIETEEAAQILMFLREMDPIEGSAEDWRRGEITRLTEIKKGDSTARELIVLQWLSGHTESFISLPSIIEGEAETWRHAMIEKFEDELGVNILSGGAAQQQRQWLIDHAQNADNVNGD